MHILLTSTFGSTLYMVCFGKQLNQFGTLFFEIDRNVAFNPFDQRYAAFKDGSTASLNG